MFPEGWDYGDVIKLADRISKFRRWQGLGMPEQIRDLAYDIIITLLMDGKDSEPYLVRAAEYEVAKKLSDWRRHGGDVDDYMASKSHGKSVPPFAKPIAAYWWDFIQTMPDPAPKVIEELALWQAFEKLDSKDKEVLATRATSDTDAAAAEKLGISPSSFARRIRRARSNFFPLWFDHEAPCKTTSRSFEPAKRQYKKAYRTSGRAWKLASGRWQAFITAKGKRTYVGTFPTEEEAKQAISHHLPAA